MNNTNIYTSPKQYFNSYKANNITFAARRSSNPNDVIELQDSRNNQSNQYIRNFLNTTRSIFNSIFNRNNKSDIQITEKESEQITEKENEKSDITSFVNSPDYDAKIKKATQGKYQESLFNVLIKQGLTENIKKELIESGLTQEEFLSAIKKLSTSTYKAALNNPTQYINYTQDANYQLFLVQEISKGRRFEDDNSSASAYLTYFFQQNIVKLARALQFIDTDTLNQMMDKRSTSFSIFLNSLNKITPENGKILKELINHTKEGDANQKIKLCQLVNIFQTNNFDMNLLKNLGEDDKINTSSLNEMFKSALIQKFGINEVNEKTKTNFNEEYIHLLLSEFPIMNRGYIDLSSDFSNLMKSAIKGNFKDYILDKTNKYGDANARTKNIYEQYGLNYQNWFNPQIESFEFDLNGQEMTLQMWERNPYEDIFIGNKTRCCTAIATGSNSAAMPIFLMNTSFNLIELTDKKGDVKGMARVYMADVEGETALIIDSIELSDIKQMKNQDKILISKNIAKYAQQFAQTVTNRPTHVFYINEDSKIPFEKMSSSKKTEFIGDVSSDKIYTNSNSSGRWSDIRNKHYIYLYQVA